MRTPKELTKHNATQRSTTQPAISPSSFISLSLSLSPLASSLVNFPLRVSGFGSLFLSLSLVHVTHIVSDRQQAGDGKSPPVGAKCGQRAHTSRRRTHRRRIDLTRQRARKQVGSLGAGESLHYLAGNRLGGASQYSARDERGSLGDLADGRASPK